MRANRNNNKQILKRQHKNRSISCEKINSKGFEDKFFKGMNMDIKDDFIDPTDNIFGFDDLEEKMFNNLRTGFGLLLDEEEPKKVNKKENKGKENRNKFNNGTVFSKVFCSSYNNIDGKEHEEKYQSQGIKQINNGHKISECKEAYKNSNGICKSSYQKGLDEKGERLIKEKNNKTGENKEHKVFRGMKENELNAFEKEYNDYSKKTGFKDSCKYLDILDSYEKDNKKLIGDGKKLNRKTNRH